MGFNSSRSESDSVGSSISRFFFRIFLSFTNPFRRLISRNKGYQDRWDPSKVGLSVLGSLNEETEPLASVAHSFDSKRLSIGALGTPKSQPIDISVFPNTPIERLHVEKDSSEHGSSNSVPGKTNTAMSSEAEFIVGSLESNSSSGKGLSSISPSRQSGTDFLSSGVLLSEDYACVKSQGPDPRVTDYFVDRNLKNLSNGEAINSPKNENGPS